MCQVYGMHCAGYLVLCGCMYLVVPRDGTVVPGNHGRYGRRGEAFAFFLVRVESSTRYCISFTFT